MLEKNLDSEKELTFKLKSDIKTAEKVENALALNALKRAYAELLPYAKIKGVSKVLQVVLAELSEGETVDGSHRKGASSNTK